MTTPRHGTGQPCTPPPAQQTPVLPKLAPAASPYVPQANPPTLTNPPDQDLVMMFTLTMASNQNIPTASRKDSLVIIHTEFCEHFSPHSILLQHIFHNCDSSQITTLFSTRQPGDILIIVWGLEYHNFTCATETRIGATLRAFFPNQEFNLQIVLPCPPPSYHTKGPLSPTVQRFITDHMGTPFMFYICGLTPKMKVAILCKNFLLTSLDSYQILDVSDFVIDFVFMIDSLNAPSDEQGQKLVEKMIKDQLYMTSAIWTFLLNHHDTIDPSYPAADILALIILSLEVWGIWIEGRRGEPR
ncbi:hypothetical protein EDD18DRAFT_1361559 [Armillaria luteobubalina]|uniref:Uncharacterized protein n=1 Tax=Armillaria luteobubalina TaxID=153913 RepID=A0AA39PIM2_9AGAR|nr:hypothetical protein EDD18DRAFT_1361559 [Armillaria luteobubalina]